MKLDLLFFAGEGSLCVQGDDLDEAFVVASVDKDGGTSILRVAVARTREDRNEKPRVVESVSVHFQFVRTDDVRETIVLQEVANGFLREVVRRRAAKIVGKAAVGWLVVKLAHFTILFIRNRVRPQYL